jgi:dihydroceramidase
MSQSFDEIPMLYSALAFAYIGICQRYRPVARYRTVIGYSLVLHAILTTWLVLSFHGKWQFRVFISSFAVSQTYALIQVVHTYVTRKARNKFDPIIIMFEKGLASYLTAFLCWLTDLFLCRYVNPSYKDAILPWNPQLHAWWHVLISAGLYQMTLLMLAERIETANSVDHCQLCYAFSLIPYLKVVKSGKSPVLPRKGKL